MFKNKITEILKDIVSEKITGIEVQPPEDKKFGHYSTNIALKLAKLQGENAMDVAEDIKMKIGNHPLNKNLFEKIEVIQPGFINFWLHKEVILNLVNSLLKSKDKIGKSDIGRGKTVMVEYFQLNIAKRPHIGHLRSAVIGDALKRMFLSFGYKAVSDTHVGDWGTQFGILLHALKQKPIYRSKKKFDKDFFKEIKEDPFAWLENLYIEENLLIEEDPRIRVRAKEEFAKLERGDKENRKIWEWMVEISMEKLKESAKKLQLLEFEEHKGESSYEKVMPKIVKLALDKGIAKKNYDGAVLVDLNNEGLDEAILLKSDGSSTYLLRDLATVFYREEKWKVWKNLYIVDSRQAHHFRQVFRVAELLGWGKKGLSEQVQFGFMSLPEGALSTRKGTAISLDEVLNEAENQAKKIINEKNPDLKNAGDVAEKIALGALKYFDLSHNRKSDIVFKWDDALSFDGNTGPYLQYTYARLMGILDKAKEKPKQIKVEADLDEKEKSLLVSISRFEEVIGEVLENYSPNILADYLHYLAKDVNEFYHSHPVIQEKDEIKKKTRIVLVYLITITLRKGLGLLGIKAPHEM